MHRLVVNNVFFVFKQGARLHQFLAHSMPFDVNQLQTIGKMASLNTRKSFKSSDLAEYSRISFTRAVHRISRTMTQ